MFFAALTILIGTVANAQNIQVSGVVKDATSGEPVPFAAIQLAGTMVGTSTDANGVYSISVPADGTLVFSSIGYLSSSVAVNGKKVVNVVLSTDSQALEETIVVAYGTTTKATFTGSAAVMKSEDIEKRQVSNITNALAGAVAGVQVTSSNGQPGTGSTVRIRGFGSINAGMAPLYVVDGIPFDGDIASINSQDIASFTVLKDAAAAALYGARGANGVISITTKKGRTGDAKINFDARVGVNSRQIKNYDVITDPNTYIETLYKAHFNQGRYSLGYNESSANEYANGKIFSSLGYQMYTLPEGEGIVGINGKINPNAKLGYSDGEYYYTPDNWAENTFQNQLRQEYNLSVTGGTEKLTYYVSGGYLGDGGVIAGSGFQRASTRANVDYQAKKWLKIGTNLSYTFFKSRYPDEQTTTTSSGNAFYIANNIAPVYPMFVRGADGNILTVNGQKVYDYGDGKSTNGTRNWMSMSNPVGDLSNQLMDYLSDVLNNQWYAKITPVAGLTLSATLGLMIDNTRFHLASSPQFGQSASYGGEAEQSGSRTRGLTQQYLANYNNTFGKHTIDALVGFEGYSLEAEKFSAYGQNLYKPGDFTVSNTIDQKTGSGSIGKYSTMGIISRINYDYAEKYFVSASYRRDASSRFHPEHRWGNFWSASVGYNIGNEEFLSGATWIDLLKIKASFGQQGNDSIGNDYAYLDQYAVTGAEGVFSDGNLVYKGNRDLTWETSNAINAGVDFAFFGGYLNGSVEYFNRQTKDMLYYKPVAASNGYSSVPMNIGSMRNSGVELDLNSNIFNTKNVKWTVFANATYLNNKIIALHPDLEGQLISGSRIYQEGESMYQLYLTPYAGVDKTNGAALYWAKDTKTGEEYLTSEYTKAQQTNRKASGNILPKVSGGFGSDLNLFGVDFSFRFSYQLGGKIVDSGYQTLMHAGSTSDIGSTWHTDILNAWTPENADSDIPRVCAGDTYTNYTSDRWLISSNYLSLENVTIGYTFPRKWTSKIGIEALRIYAAADNVAVFSARKGLDPRQSFTSATTSLYTALRTVSGGIKLTF